MDAWAASMLFTLLKEGEGGRFAAKGGPNRLEPDTSLASDKFGHRGNARDCG